jgi:hypothetical protein
VTQIDASRDAVRQVRARAPFHIVPVAAITVLGPDLRRRSIATLCLLCAATILVVLTTSQTKIFWYATPILPFLAIAAARGVTDGLRWIKAREPQLPKLFCAPPLQIGLGILLAFASATSLYRNQVVKQRAAEQASEGQLWYGALYLTSCRPVATRPSLS